MNLNSCSKQDLSFGRLYVSDKLKGLPKYMAEDVAQKIEYSDEISDLDEKGVDVLILRDSANPNYGVKTYFVDKNNKLYKTEDGSSSVKSFLYTNHFDIYIDGVERILDVARKILSGELAETTNYKPKPFKEEFLVRENSEPSIPPLDETEFDIVDYDDVGCDW